MPKGSETEAKLAHDEAIKYNNTHTPDAPTEDHLAQQSYSPHSTTVNNTPSPNHNRCDKRHLAPASVTNDSDNPSPEERPSLELQDTAVSPDYEAVWMAGANNNNNAIKHLARVRRILSALHRFAYDTLPETGDRVKALIVNLMSGGVGVEEFQQHLEDITHFPVKPYVLPYLKAHLPALQQEVLSMAKLAKTSPQQYLRQSDSLVLDPNCQSGDSSDIFNTESQETSRKRVASSTMEFGDDNHNLASKRRHAFFDISSRIHNTEMLSVNSNQEEAPLTSDYSPKVRTSPTDVQDLRKTSPSSSSTGGTNLPWNPITPTRSLTNISRAGVSVVSCGSSGGYSSPPLILNSSLTYTESQAKKVGIENDRDEEWTNIHTMLNCILSMVDKTKRALTILQQRAPITALENAESHSWRRRSSADLFEPAEFRRQAGELMAQTLKATEDRVIELKRKAEEAVLDVKRVALAELQRAISAAEARAVEALTAERLRNERLLAEACRPTDTTRPTDNKECCWNCGRKATETCSGCNTARYCGSYCQHKNWEVHHKVCGKGLLLNHHQTERIPPGAEYLATMRVSTSAVSEVRETLAKHAFHAARTLSNTPHCGKNSKSPSPVQAHVPKEATVHQN